jgi:hypothetical protein
MIVEFYSALWNKATLGINLLSRSRLNSIQPRFDIYFIYIISYLLKNRSLYGVNCKDRLDLNQAQFAAKLNSAQNLFLNFWIKNVQRLIGELCQQ